MGQSVTIDDILLTKVGKQLIDLKALELRIKLMERELKAIGAKDAMMSYLLQYELEKAYKLYLLDHRQLINVELPCRIDDIMLTPLDL